MYQALKLSCEQKQMVALILMEFIAYWRSQVLNNHRNKSKIVLVLNVTEKNYIMLNQEFNFRGEHGMIS